MEHFLLKLLPIVLLYIFSFSKEINCQCETTVKKEENYLMVKSIFDQKTEIGAGNFMECEILKNLVPNDEGHIFTQTSSDTKGYVLFPPSKYEKCFSYEVRTDKLPHVVLSSTSTPVPVSGKELEIILEYSGYSHIRTKDGKHVSSYPMTGIVNDRELRGFWIRWLDDHLIEVGRNTDNSPILSYRLPEKLLVNFIGIWSCGTTGEWIIHSDPKCGQYNVTGKMKTETKCKIIDKKHLAKTSNLQKSQEHILNQITLEHEIFKTIKFKTKKILIVYQDLITKHFRNAEENQNQIYAADNEVYCPLKSTTFTQIAKIYFKFLEELEMEFSLFPSDTVETHNETLHTHSSGGPGCVVTVQNHSN